jgi:tetratricopeptide (TPR) repeat protein
MADSSRQRPADAAPGQLNHSDSSPANENSEQHLARSAAAGAAKANRQAAVAMTRLERLDEALACWERVLHSMPEDLEAARAVSRLSIELARRRAGLAPQILEEPWASPPGRADDSTAAPSDRRTEEEFQADYALRSPAGMKLTPIQQLEFSIRDQPANPEFYLKLVPLYLEKERDYDAERLLERGKEATGDARVRKLWEDVTMLRMGKKIEFARREAERDDTPTARAQLVELRAERDRWEIEVFSTRCQREPANPVLRFELGLRLKRAGKLRTACQEFQEALASPAQKAGAALELGECLAQFFEYPEALKHYRMAADAALAGQQVELRKEALYRAAELAQRVKLRSPARRYLAELLQIDPNYRNAAGLLETMPQVVV